MTLLEKNRTEYYIFMVIFVNFACYLYACFHKKNETIENEDCLILLFPLWETYTWINCIKCTPNKWFLNSGEFKNVFWGLYCYFWVGCLGLSESPNLPQTQYIYSQSWPLNSSWSSYLCLVSLGLQACASMSKNKSIHFADVCSTGFWTQSLICSRQTLLLSWIYLLSRPPGRTH